MSAASSKNVGRNVAKLINHIVSKLGAKLVDIHVMGHSLGAHASGFAGMIYTEMSGEKLGRVSGFGKMISNSFAKLLINLSFKLFIDPAYPGFENLTKINELLNPNAADFVDVIHTSVGNGVGHPGKLGHVDFWPNSGNYLQPGCDYWSEFNGCSHGRSYQYFAESINTRNGFMSLKCGSWADYLEDQCIGELIPMGDAVPSKTQGNYYLKTAGPPVFAIFI